MSEPDSDIPYTERELIQRALSSAFSEHASKCSDGVAVPEPRWELVKLHFLCGSTVASLICYKYGLDPEVMVGELAEEGDE